jgi:hypothetical protein
MRLAAEALRVGPVANAAMGLAGAAENLLGGFIR